MEPNLGGKVALVTGAGSGIGCATAQVLARHGARVAAISRSNDEIEAVAAGIKGEGGEAIAVPADISKPDQMEKAVQRTMDKWGRLDIVFANAGVNGVWAPIEQLAPEEFAKTLDINLNGTFYTIKYAVPYLKQRPGSSVVITSSVNGTRMFSNIGATAYACSKGAQVVMAKMLALELAQDKIRVNVICPGAIRTKIEQNMEVRDPDEAEELAKYPRGKIPLTNGKPGTSEQVARLVLFLVSDDADHITGSEIWIDGAQSLLQG